MLALLHRRGFATEAARVALAYAFDTVGADSVCSLIVPQNAASIRVARRLGEHYERALEFHGRAVHVYATRAADQPPR